MRDNAEKEKRARRFGAILQGLVLGALVSAAIVELWAQAGDVRLFRYQNF